MFVCQAYADKKEGEDNKRMGVKIRKSADFLAAAMTMPDEQFASAIESLEREFRKQGVSKFMSTLTPGAQNAINASSFVWGYENAARYVQNAMKLDEVKNAANTEQRSKATVESVQQQAGAETKVKETTTFAWGYYNDDMKQSQAVAGVSETVKEKEKTREEMQQQSGIIMPLNAAEAVSMGLSTSSSTPEMLYCSAAGEAVHERHLQEQEEQKRIRLERLEKAVPGEPRIIALTPEESRIRVAQETQKEAEKRVEALIREHDGAEKQLEAALVKLDSVKDEREAVKKTAAMLPSELARAILSGKGKYAKRKVVKKKLLAWLAFSRSGKKVLSGLSLGKLLKIASLSSLFR